MYPNVKPMLGKMRQMTPHPVAKSGLLLLPRILRTLEKAKNNHSEISFTQSNLAIESGPLNGFGSSEVLVRHRGNIKYKARGIL